MVDKSLCLDSPCPALTLPRPLEVASEESCAFFFYVIYNSNLQMFITGFNNEAVHQTGTDESTTHPSLPRGGVDARRREGARECCAVTCWGLMAEYRVGTAEG